MNSRLKHSLFVTIVVASTCLSCIMAMRQYVTHPGHIIRAEGEYSFQIWWARYDDEQMRFVSHAGWVGRGDPCDSALVFDLVYIPSDTLHGDPMTFSLDSLRIWFDASDEPLTPKLTKDTSFVIPDNWYRGGRMRRLSYGPIIISEHEPNEILITFDLIFLDSTLVHEIGRQHIATQASRKTKSYLMDFIDGQ